MKLSRRGELYLLDKIRNRFGLRRGAVIKGIGDDAAVLRSRPGRLVLTTDMMLEGVHFDPGLITPLQLGFKLLSVNVSDIYAMAGRPAFALLGIAVPGDTDEKFIDRFLDGVEEACGTYGLSVIGGDVSSAKKAAYSATVLGYVDRPVYRSGARAGHRIYVTGTLGDSACGLALLKRIKRPVELNRPSGRPFGWKLMEPVLRRHLMPEARRPGAISRHASALIDLSDGLLIDLTRLCAESKVGARLYSDRIPLSEETRALCVQLGLDPLELALTGGEDYELLFTAPKGRRFGSLKATDIGEITASGTTILYKGIGEMPFGPEGYQHFK